MALSLKKRHKTAFSLIEMLVVVGVILVLAAAIYPALMKAKEWGRTARCGSNLHQLQLATLNLATDRNRLPTSSSAWWLNAGDGNWYHHRGWVDWYTWAGAPSDGPQSGKPADGTYNWRGSQGLTCVTNGELWSYARYEDDIYLCPTFALKSICGQTDAARSYSMNSNLSWSVYFEASSRAARTVLFGDDRNVGASPYDPQFGTNEMSTWHAGKGQVVYLDGHVDKL